MKEAERGEAALKCASILEKEGAEFYERASKVAADPRARSLFHVMAESKLEAFRILSKELRELAGGPPLVREDELDEGPTDDLPQVPRIYAVNTLVTAACYVCGEEVPVDALPRECPSCGASRYTFERDIDVKRAATIVQEDENRCLDFYREHVGRVSGGARQLLERLIQRSEARLRDL